MVQLEKYDAISQRRKQIAAYYNEHLNVPRGSASTAGGRRGLFALCIRVPRRGKVIDILASKGIQAGRVIEYNIPLLKGYQPYAGGVMFPNAQFCSRSMINLLIYPSLRDDQIALICRSANTLK
jgi:dTDP-4-amino-4,6-dideoxygalactose transaminase